jgi:hypothetical protein
MNCIKNNPEKFGLYLKSTRKVIDYSGKSNIVNMYNNVCDVCGELVYLA